VCANARVGYQKQTNKQTTQIVGDKIRTRVVNPSSGVAKQWFRGCQSDMAYKYIQWLTAYF